ncbi:MAG: tetratricopeptide repeat protein [Myxococcota bacterium]
MPFGERRIGLWLMVLLVTIVGIELGARAVELARGVLLPPPAAETAFAVLRNPVPAFERARPDGGGPDVYRRTRAHWIPYRQSFLADKPADGLRVFSLGGSAALGWPHGDEGSYARMLERKLAMLYPHRSVEVVNAAGNTYASYRVRGVFDEIVGYQPDAIVLWTGNNEFFEDLAYGMVEPPWPWRHSAVARILHETTGLADAGKAVVEVESYAEADLTASRIGTAFGRKSRLRSDPEQYDKVVAHYRDNLVTMAREARRRGIPLVLVDVPVNLKDWRPNASLHRSDLTDAERDAFTGHYREGVLALEAGRLPAAVRAFDRALAVDDGHAETHYLRGRALLRAGRRQAARDAFLRSLAADACPFRDVPRFAEIRRRVARDFGLPLVDAPGALAELASDGIPGLDVLVDYVHPTLESNERIAHEVLAAMARRGILPPDRALSLVATRLRVPPGAGNRLRVLLKLYPQFLIMRQYDQIGALAARIQSGLIPRPGDTPERIAALNALSRRIREAQRVLVPYQKLLRAEKLGTLEQEFTRARAERVHRRYAALIRDLESRGGESEETEAVLSEFEYASLRD